MEEAFALGFAIVIAVLATATRTKPWRNGLSNGMSDMMPDCIVLPRMVFQVLIVEPLLTLEVMKVCNDVAN